MTKRIELEPFSFEEIIKLYKWKLPELSVKVFKGSKQTTSKKTQTNKPVTKSCVT